MPKELIDDKLFVPMAAEPMTVCTGYKRSDPESLLSDSYEAQILEERIVATLAEMGVTAVPCPSNAGGAIKIISTITLSPIRTTGDGYNLSSAVVEVHIVGAYGTKKGSYR